MSKITNDELARIAALARIGLSDAELASLGTDVGRILQFVDQLQKIDTHDVLPTSQVTGLQDVWREDVVKRSPLSRDELLRNAPATERGYIKVKRILQ